MRSLTELVQPWVRVNYKGGFYGEFQAVIDVYHGRDSFACRFGRLLGQKNLDGGEAVGRGDRGHLGKRRVVKTEWGPLQFEMMLGADGVLVVTMKDAHWGGSGPRPMERSVSDRSATQLIRKDPADRDGESRGNTLDSERRAKADLTRKSRTRIGRHLPEQLDTGHEVPRTRARVRRPGGDPPIRRAGGPRLAIPVLRERLKDREVENRQLALDALVSIGPDKKEVLPLVLKTLNDKSDPILSRSAADGLGEFGPKAKEAVPAFDRGGEGRARKRRWPPEPIQGGGRRWARLARMPGPQSPS